MQLFEFSLGSLVFGQLPHPATSSPCARAVGANGTSPLMGPLVVDATPLVQQLEDLRGSLVGSARADPEALHLGTRTPKISHFSLLPRGCMI